MDTIAGYARTGRQLLGPASDLVELQSSSGQRLTSVVFHPEYRGHNAINAALDVVVGFLEAPMVDGLAELVAHDRANAGFVYPTGQAWSVAEVIRTLSDLGECAGVRAGVELMKQCGTILVEAAEVGESAGVYSHGGLTPWRVLLGADGRVQIIGHALPQVEILVFHETPDRIPREDAFRYCPPERMEARRENFTSDLFGVALIAFELMTGRPVYDGLINDIRIKAARGEGSRRLQQFREQIPASVRELLTTALRPEFRDRFQSGSDFLDAVGVALDDRAVVGAGLREVMQRVAQHQPRARQALDAGATAAFSREDLKKMADAEELPASKPLRQSVNVARSAEIPARSAAVPSTSPPPTRVPPAAALPAAVPSARVPSRAVPVIAAEDTLPPPAPVVVAAPVVAAPPPPVTAPPPAAPVEPGRPPMGTARRPPRLGAAMNASQGDASPAPLPAGPSQPLSLHPPGASTPPSAEPGRPTMGAGRLPPSRRPPSSLPSISTPPPAVAGPAAPSPDVVQRILGSSGGHAREARERLERAMRTSGGGAAESVSPTTPPPPTIPGAPSIPGASAVSVSVPQRGRLPQPAPLATDDPDTTARIAARATEERLAAEKAAAETAAAEKAAAERVAAEQALLEAEIFRQLQAEQEEQERKVRADAERKTREDADRGSTEPRAIRPPVLPPRGGGRDLPLPPPVPGDDEDDDDEATNPTPMRSPALASPAPEAAKPRAASPTAAPPVAAPALSPAPASPPAPALPASLPTPSRSPSPVGARAPEPIESRSRGEPVAVRFARAPGQRGIRRRLPGETSLAEAAHMLIGQVVPLRTTPDGRVAGWWRIGPEFGPLPVDMRLDELDDEETYTFHFVANETLFARVEVEGAGSMRLALGTGVPVVSLVDALGQQLDLPADAYALALDGVTLDSFHVLADHAYTPSSVVSLRKVKA